MPKEIKKDADSNINIGSSKDFYATSGGVVEHNDIHRLTYNYNEKDLYGKAKNKTMNNLLRKLGQVSNKIEKVAETGSFSTTIKVKKEIIEEVQKQITIEELFKYFGLEAKQIKTAQDEKISTIRVYWR